MREVAIKAVAVLKAPRLFEINSAELTTILNGFADDIRNVAEQLLENIRRLEAGEALLNQVDIARGY